MMDLFTYNLSSEQIYCKVGNDVELRYPNQKFLTYGRGVLAVLMIAFLLCFINSNVMLTLLILQLNLFVFSFVLLYLISIGRDWINTLLTCIDTIFVLEEVLRRKKAVTLSEPEVRRRRVAQEQRDVEMGRQLPLQPTPAPSQGQTELLQPSKSDDYLKLDMGKLNAALKGSFKLY
jgi:hypothetical protein